MWQRDFDGAADIRSCLLADARGELRPKASRRGYLPTRAIFTRSCPTEKQGRALVWPLAVFVGEYGGVTPFICLCYGLPDF